MVNESNEGKEGRGLRHLSHLGRRRRQLRNARGTASGFRLRIRHGRKLRRHLPGQLHDTALQDGPHGVPSAQHRSETFYLGSPPGRRYPDFRSRGHQLKHIH